MLFAELAIYLQWVVCGDVVNLVVDAPLDILGVVYSPNIDCKAQIVALLNPLGMLLHNLEVVVDACVTLGFTLGRSHIAVQVCDLNTLGAVGYKLVAYMLAESDILNIFLKFETLHHLKNVLYYTSLALGSVVALNLDDEFCVGIFLCLNKILFE